MSSTVTDWSKYHFSAALTRWGDYEKDLRVLEKRFNLYRKFRPFDAMETYSANVRYEQVYHDIMQYLSYVPKPEYHPYKHILAEMYLDGNDVGWRKLNSRYLLTEELVQSLLGLPDRSGIFPIHALNRPNPKEVAELIHGAAILSGKFMERHEQELFAVITQAGECYIGDRSGNEVELENYSVRCRRERFEYEDGYMTSAYDRFIVTITADYDTFTKHINKEDWEDEEKFFPAMIPLHLYDIIDAENTSKFVWEIL